MYPVRFSPGVILRGTDMEGKTLNGHLADLTEPVNYVAVFASAAAESMICHQIDFLVCQHDLSLLHFCRRGFGRSSIDHNHHILVCCTYFFFNEFCRLLAHDRADLLAHRCRLLNARTSNSRVNGPTAYT